MVSGHMCPVLPQIGRWWVQGRLVVGMGHTSECGVVVASVGAPPWPILSGGSQAMGDGTEVVGEWANVVTTPPDRRWVVAGPVGSGHGSYQLVSWWGGQCWCPPMAHTQWWQSGSGGSETAASTLSCRHVRKISEKSVEAGAGLESYPHLYAQTKRV